MSRGISSALTKKEKEILFKRSLAVKSFTAKDLFASPGFENVSGGRRIRKKGCKKKQGDVK